MTTLSRWKLLLLILNLMVFTYIIHKIFKLNVKVYHKSVVNIYPIYQNLTTHRNKNLLDFRNVSLYQREKSVEWKTHHKMLLFWSPQHWFDDWVGKKWNTSHVFNQCSVSNCILTKHRIHRDKADVVLFRARDLKVCQRKETPGQIWIMFEHEAPPEFQKHINVGRYCHHHLFNWTMTYRRDSDFTFLHGQFSKVPLHYDESVTNSVLRAKTKTAVAFISHCPTHSHRLHYIHKLQQLGIDIDIYGKCGTLQCRSGFNRKDEFKAIWNVTSNLEMERDCFDVLDSRYKFYLSFENGLCDDYVTEKSLHLVLRHNIVPIIRDASNHSLFHPPKSYLDTKDFKNVESLANHIKKLSRNFREYKKYFHWKKYYTVETVSAVLQSKLCQICERLHNQHKYQRVYRDIVGFLLSRGDNSPICHQPSDL